jgi:hypothetical protein
VFVSANQGATGSAAPYTTLATSLLLPASVGAGFAVRFVNPKRHAGAWTDAETLAAAVQAHNDTRGDEVSTEVLVEQRQAVYAERQLFLDFDGRVVDADRHAVPMKTLALQFGDQDTLDAYTRRRTIDKSIWITTTAAGGGLALVGGFGVLIGGLIVLTGGDPDVFQASGLVLLAGLGGVGTGVGGLFVSRAIHNDPSYWYDEPTLRSRLDRYDEDLRRELLIPSTAWRIQVQPILGPGVVGLAGTF